MKDVKDMTLAELTEVAKGNANRDKVLGAHFTKLRKHFDAIMAIADFANLLPDTEFRKPNGADPAPKAKRKPVEATSDQCGLTLHELRKFPTAAVSAKQLRQMTTYGPKILGAALRQLVAEGKAIEKPSGKFRAVQE